MMVFMGKEERQFQTEEELLYTIHRRLKPAHADTPKVARRKRTLLRKVVRAEPERSGKVINLK